MNKTKKIKVETPIGSIESDSGNHLMDIGTIMVLSLFLVLIVNLIRKS
tara:strand:+ start:412 stop:555 length:144 start_codon:yes stop_codon:yes gene_type:complete